MISDEVMQHKDMTLQHAGMTYITQCVCDGVVYYTYGIFLTIDDVYIVS